MNNFVKNNPDQLSSSIRGRFLLLSLFCFVFYMNVYATVAHASVSSGTIDATSHSALVCHDVSCASPLPGSINFLPTGTTTVTIDDTLGMNGTAWGNELGWINFNPTGPEGVVVNTTTGALSGKAWSQVSGWMNFSPTGRGVSIDASGQFVGWAWVGGPYGGWIKFDCVSASSCVKTDWRPLSARSSGGGGGIVSGGGGTYTPNINPAIVPVSGDVCANLFGIQSSIPNGFVRDQGDICSLLVDYCPNIPDIQYIIPSGITVNAVGNCVASKKIVTHTPNKSTIQKPIIDDVCLNITGIQDVVPQGYVVDTRDNCVPQATDYCPNIAGSQYTVPLGFMINVDGNCISRSALLPHTNTDTAGYSVDAGGSSDILSYSFIPHGMRIPSENPIARTVLRLMSHAPLIGTVIENNISKNPYIKTDLTSVVLTATLMFLLLFLLYKTTRLFLL
jgi:hypothetical protein